MGFKSPFFLGDLELPSNIFCSPLAGCSDFPFRQMTSRYRPGLIFCEMVKMDALIRHDPNTYRILDYDTSMHPIGAQLCGSKPELAGPCARIIEELGFDLIDLNCGCPVDKVTKDQSGSGLLKSPQLIGEIVSNMVASVKIPVTVKIRAGWDEQSINSPEITEIVEQAGAKILFVHGRTRSQAYRGPANWEYIKACKARAKKLLVFGNGDIVDPLSGEKMFKETRCDGLLLARGTFGNPWLIEELALHLQGEKVTPRTPKERREALLQHLEYIIRYQPEKKGALDLRRIGGWYLKEEEGIKALREVIVRTTDLNDAMRQIEKWQTS